MSQVLASFATEQHLTVERILDCHLILVLYFVFDISDLSEKKKAIAFTVAKIFSRSQRLIYHILINIFIRSRH